MHDHAAALNYIMGIASRVHRFIFSDDHLTDIVTPDAIAPTCQKLRPFVSPRIVGLGPFDESHEMHFLLRSKTRQNQQSSVSKRFYLHTGI